MKTKDWQHNSTYKLVKKNKYFSFLLILYIFSLFYIKETIFLFYNSSDSPDFMRYFTFLEFNYGVVNQPQSEQGFIFYDLHSYYLYLRNFNFTSENFFIYISKSIQEMNFILFIIGSAGVYRLLKTFNYDKIQILTSLILINYLPISVAQRMVFKPEIFAFALMPWLFVALEKFIITKEIKFLFISIPLFASLSTQKGSIFAMLALFIFLFYFSKIFIYLSKNNTKHFFLLLIIIFLTIHLVVTENNSLNNRGFFDLESGSQTEEKYNNTGSLSLFYKFNPEKMFFYPYKHLHNQSAIHITLLDSFGDYFDLYWDNDSSNFYKLRHDLFILEKSNFLKLPEVNFEKKEIIIFVQDENPNYFLRKTTSAILASVFFLYFLTFFQRADKDKKKFFIMPYVGYCILLIHVITGFPENNFDPNIGDTLKPFYYSFFIVIAFSFTISELVKSKPKSIFLLFLLIPSFLYIFGFPRQSEYIATSDLQEVNIYSEFCNINNFIFALDMEKDCKKYDKQKKYSDYINFKDFTKQPSFHIINFLLIVANLLGIIYLQIYELKFPFFKTIKKRTYIKNIGK